jgi:hypothetical protein
MHHERGSKILHLQASSSCSSQQQLVGSSQQKLVRQKREQHKLETAAAQNQLEQLSSISTHPEQAAEQPEQRQSCVLSVVPECIQVFI